MLTPELELRIRMASIEQHARDREACGLIVNGEFIQVENTAENPTKDFRIAPEHLARRDIDAIWHSHINNNQTLSPLDITSCLHHQIPFILYLVPANAFKVFDPRPNTNYLDRPPAPGINDCWSIIDHWYRFELGIKLPTFDRGEFITNGWSAMNQPDWNPFLSRVESTGFDRISLDAEYKYGDVLVFQTGSKSISHAAVLIDVDESLFLHQMYNQPSRIDRLSGSWRDNLMAIGRFKGAT
jgi:proteasome lid subunit RPN8/RPN11